MRSRWQEPWGDRRQEIVFIGVQINEAQLRDRLNACLMSEVEWKAQVPARA